MRRCLCVCLLVACLAPAAGAQMSTKILPSATQGQTTEAELTDLLTTLVVSDSTKTFLVVYTLSATKTAAASATTTVQLRIALDGGTVQNQTLTLGPGTSTIQIFKTHSGLSLGSHTWRVYAAVNASGAATYQPPSSLFVGNVDGTALIDGFPVVPSTAQAGLPPAGTPGRLARGTDGTGTTCGPGGTLPTLCLDSATAWRAVSPPGLPPVRGNWLYTDVDQTVSASHHFTGHPTGTDSTVNWTAASGSGPQSSWRLEAPTYPTTAEFSSGVAPIAQVVMGGANAPPESTLTHVAGGAVGVYGQGSSAANSPNAWGGNFVVENDGHHPGTMWGVEVDMNNIGTDAGTSAGDAGGSSGSGGSTMQAPGTFAAFLAFPAGIFTTPNIKWKNAFLSASGAADNGISLFPKESTGA